MTKCPLCKARIVYEGLNEIECENRSCANGTKEPEPTPLDIDFGALDYAIWPMLSESKVNMFRACPRKWAHGYWTTEYKETQSKALEMGRKIHKTLEYLLEIPDVARVDHLHDETPDRYVFKTAHESRQRAKSVEFGRPARIYPEDETPSRPPYPSGYED